MGDWFVSIAGTQEGARVASILAVSAAFLHAVFGALQKGRHDPWVSRAAIDVNYGILALPVALFLVPWPALSLWPVLLGAMAIHILYKLAQASTYQRGAYAVVYPVVRGTAPLITISAATMFFGESYGLVQWLGVLLLVAGILGLAVYNWRKLTVGRETLLPALIWAVFTGATVALYTTYDAWGIRQTADPFTFLAWFFLLDSLFMPLIAGRRIASLPKAELPSLALRGLIGALVALASFGAIMLATLIDEVGRAAVLRETSTVFAALVGWGILGEKVGPRRAVLMTMIAAGAVIVEYAT